MTTIEMRTSRGAVPYLLGAGALAEAPALLAEHIAGRRCFVISDASVAPLHARELAERLAAPLFAVPAGEEHKRWPTVESVVHWLLAAGVERTDVVVAVGGGVVTDLVGFAAAVTLRGVAWVAVPTTLLAMVDAAIGGKTGVDLDEGKNLLGAFWQPAAVLADPLALATLDARQRRAGMVEVVKAAMIAPQPLRELYDRHAGRVLAGDLSGSASLIAAAVRVKAGIVTADEREGGVRASLNLGHTVGHALEAATGYQRFLHGEAVAWGLEVAIGIAAHRRMLSRDEACAWRGRVAACGPLPAIADLEWSALEPFIARDKKRAGGETRWVLPIPGGVEIGVAVPANQAREAWEAVRAEAR